MINISEKCAKSEHQDCHELTNCSCKCHIPVENPFDFKKVESIKKIRN